MAWNNIYILSKEVSSSDHENLSMIRIPGGPYKGSHVSVPKKLLRDTKKKTVKNFSYTDDFSFDVHVEDGGGIVRISADDFNHMFADMHKECHSKIYGRR